MSVDGWTECIESHQMADGRDTQELVRQFRSAGAQRAGRLTEEEGKGAGREEGSPAAATMSLVMFQLVRAGPSTSKHFPGLAGPSQSPSVQVSPSQGVAAPCNYACLPVQGATWAWVPRYTGRGGRQGTWAPAAGLLSPKVSTTKAVKKRKAVFEPQCLHCIGAVVRVDRTAGTSCNANKQTTQQASNPSATVNHCQPLR